ncbi:Flp family type IVb pilin [Devosia sp.]|uniref:Flp family type IVb pilin n=1 Tax=Devosia sp. TaxID=1871048 RepID=UPI0026346428|nr:Flp family type IVb pilin [Devosia sp.]
MSNLIEQFAQNESGATAIEYGLIAALISVTLIGAATIIGGNLQAIFTFIADKLNVTV